MQSGMDKAHGWQHLLIIGYGLIGALLAYLLNDIKGINWTS